MEPTTSCRSTHTQRKPPGELPKGRSCRATWRRLGTRNSRTSRIGTCGVAAAGKGNPIPFHPYSRAPTRRDIANTTAEHLWLDLKPAQKGRHELHRRQAPTYNCYTPPKYQTSPDDASKEDMTHQAPPPPIPGQDLSFRLGGMAGVWRRAHGCNSNEQNDAKGRRRRRVGNTNKGFPRARPAPPARGSPSRHQIRRPEARNQANPARRAERGKILTF